MSNKKNNWYEVSKNGLKKLLHNKPKSFILYELFQNGWDQNTPFVEVECSWSNGSARIMVTDGDPDGFLDIANAYTLFAESEKRSDITKRGRFCIGEKLVLAFCEEARILSTKGGIIFSADGTRKKINKKRKCGSSVECIIKMTKAEYTEMCNSVYILIPPQNIKTTFNGEVLQSNKFITSFIESLPTK